MASDTDDVVRFRGGRGEGGRLIATSWHGYGCDLCSGWHFELIDDNDRVFAAMLVEAEDLIGLANKLLEFAKKLAAGEVANGKLN